MVSVRGLRDRVAAQSAMASVLDLQRHASPRSPFARLLGLTPLPAGSRGVYREALGELIVGDILDSLGPRWDVLHDVPLTDATLDHLVIGPAGVLAVRAVHQVDRDVVITEDGLVAAGEATDDLAHARRDAQEVSLALERARRRPVPVTAVLVVVRPRRLLVRNPSSSVLAVSSSDVARVLDRAPRTLSGDEVAELSDLADLDSTWPAPTCSTVDLRHVHRSFAEIRARVESASVRRTTWLVAGVLAASGVVWLLVASLIGSLLAR